MPVSQVKWRLGKSARERHKGPEFNIKSSFGACETRVEHDGGLYRAGILEIYLSPYVYLLSFEFFFRLRAVKQSRRRDFSEISPPFPATHLLLLVIFEHVSLVCVIWIVAFALRYVGFLVLHDWGDSSKRRLRREISYAYSYLDSTHKYRTLLRTFIEPVDSSGFSLVAPETREGALFASMAN